MQYSKTILPNGLRLVLVPMKDHPTVTVMVLVEAGSKYEEKRLNGVSHFLEHLCFKGTVKRPKPIDIVKELDGIGAQYNAFTGQELTGYFAKSDPRHFAKILDVVSDIYLHSTFPEGEMEKEKGVIVEEIKMYRDLPPRRIHDVLFSLLYDDQPAGWDVAGTEETVKAMRRADVVSYRGKHYVPKATAVIVAGGFDPAEAKEAVAEAFKRMPDGRKSLKVKTRDAQRAPAVAIEAKQTDQVHLAFGLRTRDLYHKDIPALKVATAGLGGGMSSRLFQKLRDELGICYYVGASHEAFSDHGLLEVTAGVPLARLPEALTAILAEVRTVRDRPMGDAELHRVKEHLIGSLYLELESSDAVANFFGAQEIMHRPLKSPEETAAEIKRVSAADVRRVGRACFTPSRLNLALIGPASESVVRPLLSL